MSHCWEQELWPRGEVLTLIVILLIFFGNVHHGLLVTLLST